MKTNLKNILGLAALGMTLLANTVPTWAGAVYTPEVVVRIFSNWEDASGSMVGARYSADSRQYIGCSLDTTPSVMCAAQDSAGNSIYCVSTDAGHVAQVQGMTDSSSIQFEKNPGSTTCTRILITDNSSNLK